jgi:hypothetical protein
VTSQAPPSPVQPDLLDHDGVQLYTVRHAPAGPRRGAVLLAGPMALERQTASITWRRWAERLASHGFEAWRFDYRGSGESTGAFAGACLSDWRSDLETVAARASRGGGPLVLVGLRVGALLAARAFADGLGDALLMWEPPPSGRDALMEVLRRRLASDYMEGITGPHATREAYVAELEAGATVEVEGYAWTERLWRDAQEHPLPMPAEDEGRPWLWLGLTRAPRKQVPAAHADRARVPKPAFWNHAPLAAPDVEELFARSVAFLEEACAPPEEDV